MVGNLDGFIAAEVARQHVRVKVVTDETLADYVLTGLSRKEDEHWYNAILGAEKDKNDGNMRVLDVRTKAVGSGPG